MPGDEEDTAGQPVDTNTKPVPKVDLPASPPAAMKRRTNLNVAIKAFNRQADFLLSQLETAKKAGDDTKGKLMLANVSKNYELAEEQHGKLDAIIMEMNRLDTDPASIVYLKLTVAKTEAEILELRNK